MQGRRGRADGDLERDETAGFSSHARIIGRYLHLRQQPPNSHGKVGYAGVVSERQDQTDGAVKERVKTEKKEPTLYKVVLLNDDYTTMEFVLHVLEGVFQKSPAEAYRIMMQVHLNGRGIAGVYPWEVAETKVETLPSLAREARVPAARRHRGSVS